MKRVLLITLLALLGGLLPTAAAAQDSSYTINGSGWGHGVGLSQYGAKAMALSGMTADQIVTSYYSSTQVQTLGEFPLQSEHQWILTDPDPLWIGLIQNTGILRFHMHNGPADLCKANDGEGECPTQTANAEENWEFRAIGGGACQFYREGSPVGNPGSCRGEIAWEDQPNTRIHIEDLGREYARGKIKMRPVGSGFHVIVEVDIDEYLYGLGEVPSSWPDAALQAQVIAARSYGLQRALNYGPEESFSPTRQAQCWCHMYATVVDQNYTGWIKESVLYGDRWVAAVDATTGRVVTHPEAGMSTIVLAYYSSSSGGHTDSNIAGFGHSTQIPYLLGVSDPWSVSPAAENPYASWTKTVSSSQIAAAVGLDTVTGVAVTERNASGSVAKVAIAGTLGGVETTLTKSGRSFRSALGMRSIFYSINAPFGAVVPSTEGSLCDEPAPDAGFTDVVDGSTHDEDIDCVAFLGVIPGVTSTTFEPTAQIPRRHMALFMIRAADRLGVAIPEPTDQGFTDIADLTQEEKDAINQMAILGLTKGTAPDKYSPERTIDRWQMAIFLVRLHVAAGFDPPSGDGTAFTDLNGFSEEAVISIYQLYNLGVTKGTSATTYSPERQVTREQMASFLARILRLDT